MPKVSVIVPVFGVEKFIERCARSLFEQTLDDIEYLFIDDCTPDRSIEILQQVLEEYSHRKQQVVIHRMEQNSGQAAVRKWGIEHANGVYITHCDSDDWVDEDMYKLLYEKGEKENLDYVVCNYYETDGLNKKEIRQQFSPIKTDMMFSFFTLWCKIVRRSLYTNNKLMYPIGNMGEDRVYTAQLAWYATSFGFVDKPLYYYYSNQESIVHTIDKDKCISIFQQRKDNTDLICAFIDANTIEGCRSNMTILKLQTLSWLYPFLYDNSIYKLWKKSYTELFKDCKTLFRTNMKECIRYYLAYIGLHRILKRG